MKLSAFAVILYGVQPLNREETTLSLGIRFAAPKEDGGLGFRSLQLVNATYMMKLGWELMTKKDSLWVQVLRFKYSCGNLLIPKICCGTRASHL